MVRQYNHYGVFPFYQGIALDTDRECPVLSPTRTLPMFQIELNAATVSGDIDVVLEDYHTGIMHQALTGIEVYEASNSKTYVTYTGNDLEADTPPGLYRVRISGEEITTPFISHAVCLSLLYNPQDWEPEITCASVDGGFSFQVDFDEHPGLPTEIEVNYGTGNGWERIGDGISGDPAMFYSVEAPNDNVRLRLKVWLNDALFYKEYLYEFDPEAVDPCDTDAMTFVNVGGHGYERFMCLEWQNTKDLQSLGLLYAGVQGSNGYLQQFYFEGWASIAGTATEETFLKNGLGESVLDSLEIARLYNVQFYGLPDPCVAPIRAANAHNVRQIRQTADGWNAGLTAITMTPEEQSGLPCGKGTLTLETNRAMVGCQDNVTEIV